MSYYNSDATSGKHEDLFNFRFEGVLPHHIEKSGVHFIINRYQGSEVESLTLNRHLTISLGENSEREIVEKKGKEMNGLYHLSEHVLVRLLQKAYCEGVEMENILQYFQQLHIDGIQFNAATTFQSMSVDVRIPHDEDFAKSISLARRILQGSIIFNLNDVIEAIGQESERIRNEILILLSHNKINEFIWSHIFTADSFNNFPNNLGTVENIKNASPEVIAQLIQELITTSPVIITIHNPPVHLSDDDIINQILGTDFLPRKDYTAESGARLNVYQDPHHWVHLEHENIPNDEKVEATVSIPLKNLTEKDIATWTILADILIIGTTSPHVEFLHYKSPSKLYASTVRLDRTSSDIQIEANIEAIKLIDFIRDILEFWQLPNHTQLIESVFERFKKRRIELANNSYQDTDTLTENFKRAGKYVSPSEVIRNFNSVTIDDVLEFHERIKLALSEFNLVTLCGVGTGKGQPTVSKALESQSAAIIALVPLKKIVTCVNGIDNQMNIR